MNEQRPTALIICFTALHKDPRVLREVEWLKDTYRLTTIGLTPCGFDDVEHISYSAELLPTLTGKLKRQLQYLTNDFETNYWSCQKVKIVERLKDRPFDLVVANDINTLPLAARLAKPGTKILFDAHEYAPLEMTDSLRWRILHQPFAKYVCREYIPQVTFATTVCKGLAEKYESEYGKKFTVITNTSAYENIEPSPTVSDKIRLIYHGGAMPSRQTHKQIEMMHYLDERFELNLMLVGDNAYIERLKAMAGSMSNVNFLETVGTHEIAQFTNQFDVGIYSLPPTNFNNAHALPNKFFEYVQARLAVAIGPSPEMARLVEQYDLGVVAQNFGPRGMADMLNGLTAERVAYYKSQASKYAYELSAESNRDRFLTLVRSQH